MGGQSVPSSTSTTQEIASGIWGSPKATALAEPILKPALANIRDRQLAAAGFMHGDPTQTRRFLGLPAGTSQDEVLHAISQLNKPVTSQVQYQPPKSAAQGGLMALQGYATGKKVVATPTAALKKPVAPAPAPKQTAPKQAAPKTLTAAEATAVKTISKAIASGKATPAQVAKLNSIETRKGINVSPYVDTGTRPPGNATVAAAVTNASNATQIQTELAKQGLTESGAQVGQAGFFGFDPAAYKTAVEAGNLPGVTTNPLYSEAIRKLQETAKTPEQFAQATQAYQDAIAGLKETAGYKPQQVTAQTAPTAQMAAPKRVSARGYNAAQAKAARMKQPKDVTGESYTAADIAKTQREEAQQIGDIGTIQGQGYKAAKIGPTAREEAATTTGPKSWTDAGTAEKYMSPYMQNVVDIQKREANRDYAQQLQKIKAGAAGVGAFGGSRQAIMESEAARNQAQRLADIEAQGLQQAYQSGMGQFSAEQGLGAQVGMSNTAQINALKQQYMQMGMTEAQANQAAVNQARQFTASQGQAAQTQNVSNELAKQQANAQMVNQLKSQYMSMGLSEAQANQMAQNQAAQYNASNAQQAALANQQMAFQTGQANLSTEQQTALANQAAINQQRSQYVTQALQAAQANQGAALTTEQQNAIMQNAVNQFNAQQNLTAQTQNQTAGLQGAQLAGSAYGQIGNMAQGLGSIGTQQGNYGLGVTSALGQAGGMLEQQGVDWANQAQQNAANVVGLPTTLGAQGMSTVAGMGGGTSGMTTTTAKQG